MPYVHRTAGKITRLTRWPNGSTELLPDDHPDVAAFNNPPAPPDAQADLDAAIAAASTLEELKAALLGQGHAGKVAGRPV